MSDRPAYNFKRVIASQTSQKPQAPPGNGGQPAVNHGLLAVEKLLKARITGLEAELNMLKNNLLELSQISHPLIVVHPQAEFVPPPQPTPKPTSFTGVGRKPPVTVVVPEEPPLMDQILDMYPDLEPEVINDILTLIERAAP